MSASDVDAVARLTTQLGYPVAADVLARRFADVSTRADHEVLVATDAADRPIGWIHVSRVATLATSDMASIDGLVVDEAHRSEGVGGALVSAAEEWARERGATTITVRSRSTRRRAHRFYERIGYAEIKLSHVFTKSLV
jgi:GNAT superfamily N-acetyltransferase